jgi:hypothetical protein
MRGVRTASFTFSARNLHTWTRYRGTDPETDFTATDASGSATSTAGTLGNIPQDFQTVGPPSYFIFRLNLGF